MHINTKRKWVEKYIEKVNWVCTFIWRKRCVLITAGGNIRKACYERRGKEKTFCNKSFPFLAKPTALSHMDFPFYS